MKSLIATSPSKPRWFSSKSGYGDSKLADKIRRQRLEEDEARIAKKLAFDTGLIGSRGVVATTAENVIIHELQKQEKRLNAASVSSGTGQGFDLNLVPLTAEGIDSG